MDIGKALTFITEDERYLEKLGIGVALLLISGIASVAFVGVLGSFILMGYSLRLLKNVRDGVEKPLPEWNQWGDDLTRGFKLMVVGLVWALPILVLVVPLAIGGGMADSNTEAAQVFGGLILFGATCLIAIYAIFVAVMMPGMTIAFAKDETIRSGLQITEISRRTMKNLGQVVIASLVSWAAGAVFGIVAMVGGLLLCIVGLVVTVPLSGLVTMLFQYHLFGQLARELPIDDASASTGMSVTNT